MKPSLHGYPDNLCLARDLENNSRWNYAVRGRCFIIISNVFRWCVTLGNRVHNISTETGLMNGFHLSVGSLIYHVNSDCMLISQQFSYFWLLTNHLLASTEIWFWNLQNLYNKNMRLTSQVFTTKIWYSFNIPKFATTSSINWDNFHLLWFWHQLLQHKRGVDSLTWMLMLCNKVTSDFPILDATHFIQI
jgi:hypothetical protein